MKKIKVSELPVGKTLKGLYTLGTDVNNNSVKVSLEFIEDKANAAYDAAINATQAAANATAAKEAADTAATQANAAASAASIAAMNADIATSQANTARDNANNAASTANNAATQATETAASAAQDARAAEAEAREAAEEAVIAATAATQATEQLLLKLSCLIPTGLLVDPVPRLTIGNTAHIYIGAHLTPEQVTKNLIFISDNRSVSVSQDGRIMVLGKGVSTIQVVPPLNTALSKVIQVVVGEPTLRLVNTRTRLRFTASGALRLN